VCGGRKGFRFTSGDINRLRQNCDDISKRFEALDSAFKALTFEVTQYKFPAHVKRIEDEPALYQELSHSCNERKSQDETVRWRAFQFQKLTRDYVNSYSRLRETVKDIRARFHTYLDDHKGDRALETLQEPGECT
jgi:hypothetical protein